MRSGDVSAVVLVPGPGVDAAAIVDAVQARPEIPFQYRWSGLDGWVVLEATVRLEAGDPVVLAAEVAKLFEWRQRGTPFTAPCCGSVFKNPESGGGGRRTAGQLIEAAGLKGTRVGGAEVSAIHANYFVNVGGATAADVRHLIDLAQEQVTERFGVTLDLEVKVIGSRGEYLMRAGDSG